MPSRVPGRWDVTQNQCSVKDGTLNLQPTAEPGVTGTTPERLANNRRLKLAGIPGKQLSMSCLDGVGIHKFFHSVAWRCSLAQSARLIWNEEKGSLAKAVAVDLYNLTLGKVFDPLPGVKWEPPSAEVITGKTEDIRQRASKLRLHYWDTLIARGQKDGPGAACAYLKELEKVRNQSIQNLKDLHHESLTLNNGIEAEIHKKLMYVAGVKLSADVGLGAIGFIAPPAGIAVQLLYGGANYAIATRLISSEEQDKSAAHQLAVGVWSSGVDLSAEAGKHLWKRFADVAGTYDEEAAAIVKNLRMADQTVTTNLQKTLTLDQKMKLAGQNWAKANNLKATSGMLKWGAGGVLFLYSVHLSIKDFADAIK